jgi:hypothetical protein
VRAWYRNLRGLIEHEPERGYGGTDGEEAKRASRDSCARSCWPHDEPSGCPYPQSVVRDENARIVGEDWLGKPDAANYLGLGSRTCIRCATSTTSISRFGERLRP